jgi:cytochrome c-type biogenesis protein CcmF
LLWGDVLLYAILALYSFGSIALVFKRIKLGRSVFVVASILGILAFASFVYLFLSNDFSVTAVFQSSSLSLPVPFKVVAALSGAGGSVLLWLGAMSAALLVYELTSRSPSRLTTLIVSFFMIYIAIALIFVNPFAGVGGTFSNGLGLTPSLQTYWALIHPPTVFSAYTAMILLFASTVSRKLQGSVDGNSAPVNTRLFYAAWVLLGLGLTFGGMWAYQTEGWGGYWAWDPIETSALIPWLALTAILMASKSRTKISNDYAFFGTTFSTSALLFTSYVARGSGAPSIHSYGDLVSGAPFVLLSLFPVLISLGVLVAGKVRAAAGASPEGERSARPYVFWCLLILATANLALLLIETFSHDLGMGFVSNPAIHNYASLPFVAGLCVMLAAECVSDRSGKKLLLPLLLIALAGGAALLIAITLGGSILFDTILPLATGLLVAGLWALATSLADNSRRIASSSTSRYLTLIAVSILLIGVLFSSSMRASVSSDVAVDHSLTVDGVNLTVLSISTAPGGGLVYLPGYGSVPETIVTSVNYKLSGQYTGTGTVLLSYFPGVDGFYPEPSIHGSLGQDLYLAAASTPSVIQSTSDVFRNGTSSNPTYVLLSIQIIPGISLVWLGAAILFAVNLPYVFLKPRLTSSETDQEQNQSHSN